MYQADEQACFIFEKKSACRCHEFVSERTIARLLIKEKIKRSASTRMSNGSGCTPTTNRRTADRGEREK